MTLYLVYASVACKEDCCPDSVSTGQEVLVEAPSAEAAVALAALTPLVREDLGLLVEEACGQPAPPRRGSAEDPVPCAKPRRHRDDALLYKRVCVGVPGVGVLDLTGPKREFGRGLSVEDRDASFKALAEGWAHQGVGKLRPEHLGEDALTYAACNAALAALRRVYGPKAWLTLRAVLEDMDRAEADAAREATEASL